MSLTTENIQTIKDLFKEQSVDTERKIETATTNLERKLSDTIKFENIKVQVALERQIRTTEDNVNKRIDQVSQRVDDLSLQVDHLQTSMEKGFDNISQKMVESQINNHNSN